MATKVLKKKAAVTAEEKTEIKAVKEVKKKTAAKKTTATKKATTAKVTIKKVTTKKASPKKEKADVKEILSHNNSDSYLVIDHPAEMEQICGTHYAIRIGASADGYVEISFDNGEWQPCRYGGGYWWFDWTYFTQGNHFVAVRLVDPNGSTIIETVPRKCIIC